MLIYESAVSLKCLTRLLNRRLKLQNRLDTANDDSDWYSFVNAPRRRRKRVITRELANTTSAARCVAWRLCAHSPHAATYQSKSIVWVNKHEPAFLQDHRHKLTVRLLKLSIVWKRSPITIYLHAHSNEAPLCSAPALHFFTEVSDVFSRSAPETSANVRTM